ncbi:MAG TPA: hypothetical protein VKR53_02275, partial [Puia sp.]|nr:hypothetical protein [Puia sp.]
KTPWFIAQMDHPHTDLASSIQFTSVIDLKGIPKQYPQGGQALPVLPEKNIFSVNMSQIPIT